MRRDRIRGGLVLAVIALSFTLPSLSRGQGGEAPESPEDLSVTRAAIARDIEDREPVGEGDTFPADVGELVCFTKVEGAGEETIIHHVWSHGGEEKARVELPVRGSSWRTWSRKRILPGWTGDWAVTVEDAEGHVLTRLVFSVGRGEEPGEAEEPE